jgi:hypothetical protein
LKEKKNSQKCCISRKPCQGYLVLKTKDQAKINYKITLLTQSLLQSGQYNIQQFVDLSGQPDVQKVIQLTLHHMLSLPPDQRLNMQQKLTGIQMTRAYPDQQLNMQQTIER